VDGKVSRGAEGGRGTWRGADGSETAQARTCGWMDSQARACESEGGVDAADGTPGSGCAALSAQRRLAQLAGARRRRARRPARGQLAGQGADGRRGGWRDELAGLRGVFGGRESEEERRSVRMAGVGCGGWKGGRIWRRAGRGPVLMPLRARRPAHAWRGQQTGAVPRARAAPPRRARRQCRCACDSTRRSCAARLLQTALLCCRTLHPRARLVVVVVALAASRGRRRAPHGSVGAARWTSAGTRASLRVWLGRRWRRAPSGGRSGCGAGARGGVARRRATRRVGTTETALGPG
jgi:hypothetical protein